MILNIRGTLDILDRSLAIQHGVETKVLNQAVKRNIQRFPPNFMFQLTKEETNTSMSTNIQNYSLILENVWQPLYEFGSSKLCRSTHVDMTSKIQVNLYVSGLHHEGSNAVHHYTKLELRDRFSLLCAAFDQPLYKVDRELNIIDEN